jgi:hypothetical protein
LRQNLVESSSNSLSPRPRNPSVVATITKACTMRRRDLRLSNRIKRMFPWLNLDKKRSPSINLRLRVKRRKRRHLINLSLKSINKNIT